MPHNRYYSGPASDHFDGRFHNAGPVTTDKGLADLLRWRRAARPVRWPVSVPVARTVPQPRVAGARVTLIGHASVLVQIQGCNVLTDPVWSDRASPLSFAGPRRVCAPGVRFDDLPAIDVVLLSHNHYDHLDLSTLRRLVQRDDPHIVTPLGNDAIVRRALPKARLRTGDWWDRLTEPLDICIVPAQHWSARGLLDRRMALWSGFVVRGGGTMVYFSGDTGYGDGSIFRAIRQRLGSPDIALLPIGAYAPRWFMRDQHVDPDEAVNILEDIGAAQGLALHWGVFHLSEEGREEPPQLLRQALHRRGIPPDRFLAPEPGHVFDIADD